MAPRGHRSVSRVAVSELSELAPNAVKYGVSVSSQMTKRVVSTLLSAMVRRSVSGRLSQGKQAQMSALAALNCSLPLSSAV